MKKFNFMCCNHMLPFLWVHGEQEETYRLMIQKIHEAGILCFCVESRPHPDFMGEQWFHDLDIILDEAKKQGMTFYILDDQHFPTGYANGKALLAENRLRRQSIFNKTKSMKKGETISFEKMKYCSLTPTYNQLGSMMNMMLGNEKYIFQDDRLLSVSFLTENNIIPISIEQDTITYTAEEDGELSLCYLTRNCGIHRSYINMLEKDSVKILLDEVYEKHYQRYKEEFGKTIVGFFSDEPEIGNSTYTNSRVNMGDDPTLDLPWCESLEKHFLETYGKVFFNQLPLLWKRNFNPEMTSDIRFKYMDAVTDFVSNAFSKQIGTWCSEHHVQYIGHVIEDNNLHSKTCTSLGHYFKGLKYQTMGGVDDIGGQVLPQGEDQVGYLNPITYRDGEFYHYTLAKLSSSMAHINPRTKGNCFCEIFGNYGWEEGVRLESYLLNHFLVRGVNHFVPHAFTCMNYPDPDCPPHFYAMGNNPQFRHFSALMAYGNRMASLLSEGEAITPIGILYHGDMEWCGKAMLIQKPAKELYDSQIDYFFLPSDCFKDREFYQTTNTKDGLSINGHTLQVLIVPECERLTPEVVKAIQENRFRTIFINSVPKEDVHGNPITFTHPEVCSLETLSERLDEFKAIHLNPAFRKLRVIHYQNQQDFLFLVNEDKESYQGNIAIPGEYDITLYDAFLNETFSVPYVKTNGTTSFSLALEPYHSIVILLNQYESKPLPAFNCELPLNSFTKSICRSIDYPSFEEKEPNDHFSGFVRYECEFTLPEAREAELYIENAYEGVEVFLNGTSLGIQINAPYHFSLNKALKAGKNQLRIEVASTLKRERQDDKDMAEMLFGFKPKIEFDPIGIVGIVEIRYQKGIEHEKNL